MVCLAALLVLMGMFSVEMLNRREMEFLLHHPIRNWSNPQLRSLATGWSYGLIGRPAKLVSVLRPLVAQRPPNEIAAAAASQIASLDFQATPAARLEYHRQSVLLAPDDSPMLAVYYAFYISALKRGGHIQEAEKVLRQGMERKLNAKQRTSLLVYLVGLEEAASRTEARKTLAAYVKRWPELAAQPGVRRMQARLRGSGGQTAPHSAVPGATPHGH